LEAAVTTDTSRAALATAEVFQPFGDLIVKKHLVHSVLAILATALFAMNVQATKNASAEEATAMVKKGVVSVKANKDATFTEITEKHQKFTDRDLYLTVYGMDGVVRAHGANPKMVGKNLIDLKDIDGKAFVAERLQLAKDNPSFWQDYKFRNPESGRIEPKKMYCERLDDMVVCGGIYK
jgi:cytochrome c